MEQELQEKEMMEKLRSKAKVRSNNISEKSSSLSRNSSDEDLTKDEIKLKKYEAQAKIREKLERDIRKSMSVEKKTIKPKRQSTFTSLILKGGCSEKNDN